MREKVEINDPTDWAIIQSFYRADKHILMLKKIVSIVRESSDKNDKAIEARIRKLVKNNYITKCENKGKRGVLKNIDNKSDPDTVSNDEKCKGMPRPGLYGLNESLEFEYTGVPLSSRLTSADIPDEIRRNHTEDLKEAIRNWMQYLPEPTYLSMTKKDQFDLSIDINEYVDPLKIDLFAASIANCEQHLLFSDLGNHLPNIGLDVCIKWEKYKNELAELNEMHRAFLISITTEVEEWLDLFMPFYKYEIPRSEGIPCNIASIVCQLLLRFVSWDKIIMDSFSSDPMPCLCGRKTPAEFKKILDVLDLPNRDRLNKRTELAPFSGIVERILQKKNIMKSANDFAVKIRDLETKRSIMVRDLEKALLYASYPGECQYLR